MRFGKHRKVRKKKEIEALSAGGEKERALAAMEAQYKRKPKKFYFRKNYRVVTAGVQSVALLPMRLKRGPIYPTYSPLTELWYRAVMKVADHHYLLSWDDLRNLYPIPPTPSSCYLRRVTMPCGLRGEFVCYVPKKEANEIKKREKDYEELKARCKKEGRELPVESPYFRNKPTIMFIHGGGFCIGTVPSYRSWCYNLSKMLGGMQLFLVDYTLSPEASFPVALQQCWKAYLWLLNPQGAAIPADRLIIAGDSAGGNLTLSLLYVIRQVRLEKERSELLAQRQRRLSFSMSSSDLPVRNDRRRSASIHKKGIVEKWIERDRERDEATLEAVQKVLEERQKDKERVTEEEANEDESDAAAADVSSEARWPACNPTERKQRAWERRTLALDDKFMLKHQLPFEIDEEDKKIFPPQPLAALLLSPWVDLSEHSSVFFYRSYPRPEKFRPYHIGLRFVQGYLNLQPSDYPFSKRKEKELRRAFHGGLKAQSKEKWATREKERARLKWEKKRWERKYLMRVMYEELRLRQVDRDEREHSKRRRESLASLREEELEAVREKSRTDLHSSEGASSSSIGAVTQPHLRGRDMYREHVLTHLSEQREKERNLKSIYSPYISPIYGDLLGLPPLLITGGDVEPLWEDIRRLHQKAQQQGIEAELYVGHHMNHDFQFFFNIMPHPEVKRCFKHTKEYLERQMNIRRQREETFLDLRRQSSMEQMKVGSSESKKANPPHTVAASTASKAAPPVPVSKPTLELDETARDHNTLSNESHHRPEQTHGRPSPHELPSTEKLATQYHAETVHRQPFQELFDDEEAEAVMLYHAAAPSLLHRT